jgi:hypothetical protein
MPVLRSSDRQTKVQPPANFTGVVFSDEIVQGSAPYCLSGAGRIQFEGQQVQEIRAGDTVIIPPNTRHWHGAAPDKLFSHLAMSEQTDKGEGTAWFEHVSEVDYNASPAPIT